MCAVCLQLSVAQSERDLVLSKLRSEENKLSETERNLEATSTTLRDRTRWRPAVHSRVTSL